MNEKLWFALPMVVALGIFSLSTFLSFPIQVEGTSGIDKWEHAFAYMVLSSTLLIAFKKAGRLKKRTMILILLTSCLYGISLELVQYLFFPNRYFEWADAVANVLGTFIGLIIFRFMKL